MSQAIAEREQRALFLLRRAFELDSGAPPVREAAQLLTLSENAAIATQAGIILAKVRKKHG